MGVLQNKAFKNGVWELLPVRGHETSWRLLAWRWNTTTNVKERRLCVINYSDHVATGRVIIGNAEPDSGQDTIAIVELVSKQVYLRRVSVLRTTGLCVQVQPWNYQVFKY